MSKKKKKKKKRCAHKGEKCPATRWLLPRQCTCGCSRCAGASLALWY